MLFRKNKSLVKTGLTCLASTLFTTACIDLTSDEKHNVGKFIDSPVTGLAYRTETLNGRTNLAGEFRYEDDESVIFSIGDTEFPSTNAQPIVTPLNVANTSNTEDTLVVNILRLLQTLDADGDPSNGIEITQTAHEAAEGVELDLNAEDFAFQTKTLEFLDEAVGADAELVDTETAVAHFTASLELSDEAPDYAFSSSKLNNQTYFLVTEQELTSARTVYDLDSLDFYQGEVSYLRGEEEVTGVYEVENGFLHLTLDDGSDDIWIAIISEANNHLVTCWANTPLGSLLCENEEDYVRFFFNTDSASLFLNQAQEPDLGAATDAGSADSGSTDSGSTDSGSTDSGSTDSGSTDSGSTDSGSTDSGSTDSGSTDSGSTDSGSTDSGSTDSGSTDSGSTDSGSTGSGSTDSGSTGSGSTDSSSTDSGSTDSGSTDSGSTDSGSTDSGSTDSGSTDSGSTDSGSTDSGSTDSGSTDSGSTDSGSTDSGSTDSGSTDSGSTDSGSTDSGSTDSGSTDSGSTDSGSTDSGSTDSGSTDSGSTNSGSTDSGSTDSGSTDSGSTDSGSTDSGSTDSGSTDSGSTDSGSTDSGSSEPDTGAASGSSNGTKFNPGHYVFMNISRGYSKSERERRRIDFVNRYINDSRLKGFIGTYDWRNLEPSKGNYDFDNIREILRMLEGTDKQFGIYLKERKFNSSCTKPPVPDYLMTSEYGGTYKYGGYVCMIKLYRQDVMDRHIALFQAIGREFDDHPNFELITTGETTIGGSDGYSADIWTNQLIRLFNESKKELKKTILYIQTNFLGGGLSYMERIAAAMADTGGGGLGLPDTVPCRRNDIPESEVCGYRIPAYDLLRAYNGKLAVTPHVETWDLIYEQTPEVFDMAVDYLGATHVLWQSEFSSRRDSRGYVSNYLDNQVLPTVGSQGGRINDSCPSELAPCISN